jgi:16S rRNA U516 pseudouridylate synthase RsuA-like enzyme
MDECVEKDRLCSKVQNQLEITESAILQISPCSIHPKTSYRSFLIHKPVGVVSSTVDSKINDRVMNPKHPMFGKLKGGDARPTVYNLAREAGFPNDCGLVGRLDFETSGILCFLLH